MNRSFVIVEADPIVSLDLVSLIKTAHPASEVTVMQSAEHVAGPLSKLNDEDCVFFNSRLIDARATEALNAVAARGGQIVFIGDMPEVAFPAFAVDMPFSSDMIMGALGYGASDPPGRPPEAHT